MNTPITDKRTKTKIPAEVTRVRNAATGEVKILKPNELSKAEVNLAIAELLFPDEIVFRTNAGSVYEVHVQPSDETCLSCGASDLDPFKVDYCNNWNDLMPEVVKYDVLNDSNQSPNFYDTLTIAEVLNRVETPQRALADCLLLVLQAKSKQ